MGPMQKVPSYFELETCPKPKDANGLERTFWFLHVSDIHLKSSNDAKSNQHFIQFLHLAKNAFPGTLVFATGDLTDAKNSPFGCGQLEEEWKNYQDLLSSYQLPFWFDLPGNHDRFDSGHDFDRYFQKYSCSKRENFNMELHFDFGRYCFTLMDFTPRHGARKPFNFFGLIENRHSKPLLQAQKIIYDHSFIFAHYPISIMEAKKTVKDAFNASLQNYSAYFCGHLHMLALNFGKDMYRHVGKFLELEVADLKSNKMARLFVIDSNLLSFTDFRIDDDIIAVLTNPKDCRFILRDKEPLELSRSHPQMRLLVFPDNPKLAIHASIDGGDILLFSWKEENLWTCSYDPSLFPDVHHVSIVISRDGKQIKSLDQRFSTSGKSCPIDSFAGWVLKLDRIGEIEFGSVAMVVVCCLFWISVSFVKQRGRFLRLLPLLLLFSTMAVPSFIGRLGSWDANLSSFYGFGKIIDSKNGAWPSVDLKTFFLLHLATSTFPVALIMLMRRNWLRYIIFFFFVAFEALKWATIYVAFGSWSIIYSPGFAWYSIACMLLVLSY